MKTKFSKVVSTGGSTVHVTLSKGGGDPPFVVASDRIRHEDVGPNVFLVDVFTMNSGFPRESVQIASPHLSSLFNDRVVSKDQTFPCESIQMPSLHLSSLFNVFNNRAVESEPDNAQTVEYKHSPHRTQGDS